MTLSDLLERISNFQENSPYIVTQGKNIHSVENLEIQGINSDSRLVQPGEIFGVFTPKLDQARAHFEQAYQRGARVMIVSTVFMKHIESFLNIDDLVIIAADRQRQLFARLTSKFYGAYPNNCVAVTGTAGKTSVCSLVLQLWKHLNIPSASDGTLGLQHSSEELKAAHAITYKKSDSALTTPEIMSMHKSLMELKQLGAEHVVMEASSHGLDQYRLDGLRFKVAAFTSFSQDHLDYHPTMEDYFKAKARLFEELITKDGWAVLNADIPEYDDLMDMCVMRGYPIYSFGTNGQYMRLKSLDINHTGQQINLQINRADYTVQFPLIGRTQVYNLMCALTIVLTLGANISEVLNAVEKIAPVDGRLNFAGKHPNGAMIYVDYAHKPQALELILKDMRPYCKGRLHVVFGCGGDRDKDKRPIMGRIAHDYADVVIITDDNPRTEDAASIRQQVLSGCDAALEIGDRRHAIEHAIQQLNPTDILVIAGKGHEKYQLIGTGKVPFDDMQVVSNYLKQLEA